MEQLNGQLFRLLKDELDSLATGHTYDLSRIRKMKEICHILTYYRYVDISNSDVIKLITYYEY